MIGAVGVVFLRKKGLEKRIKLENAPHKCKPGKRETESIELKI